MCVCVWLRGLCNLLRKLDFLSGGTIEKPSGVLSVGTDKHLECALSRTCLCKQSLELIVHTSTRFDVYMQTDADQVVV